MMGLAKLSSNASGARPFSDMARSIQAVATPPLAAFSTSSRPSHALYGERYVGRVLVLNTAKGGVATAWMLRAMSESGLAPLALLLNFANPIMAQGAAFAGLPLIDRFEADITAVLHNGDEVEVDPASGCVTVLRRSA